MEDQYVIFWYYSGVSGDHHYETFETLEAAQSTLADWAKFHPSNTYHLAKIIGTQEATRECEEHPALKITFTDSGYGSKASVTVVDGAITKVVVR